MPQFTSLTLTSDGPYRIVTMSRPERMNALSRTLLHELGEVFEQLALEVDARVVILTGVGDKAFCAGADLKERQGMSENEIRALLGTYRKTFAAIDQCPKPVVAAINGVALGGGFEVALACDLRIAVTTAVVGLPETSLAIIPGAGGTQRLSRLVGPGRAKELILLARRLPAEEALKYGLVTAVANEGESAVDAAKRFTASLASGAPIAYTAAMEAIDVGFEREFEAGLDLEHLCYERTLVSSDRREALAAFAEKRPPKYRGQ